ncbi:MAG: GrpB family protein [Alphaproteobacteria bacterium]|nr:GrpB family protein [Alphaproteobacteria bacterium]
MDTDELQAYSMDWATDYENETKLLKKVLASNLIEVHHIGSTAIKGIMAKPKIDIAVAVQDLAATDILTKIGYKFRGEYNIPFRFFFSKKDGIEVHLHVMLAGNHEIDGFLCFRDYMNSNTKARQEYSDFKVKVRNLRQKKEPFKIFDNYTLAKNEIIPSFIRKSGFSKICMRFVSHNIEEQYEKEICKANDLIVDSGDIRVVLYKGADIIGYACASDSKIKFIKSSKKTAEFKEYLQKYLEFRKSVLLRFQKAL